MWLMPEEVFIFVDLSYLDSWFRLQYLVFCLQSFCICFVGRVSLSSSTCEQLRSLKSAIVCLVINERAFLTNVCKSYLEMNPVVA